MDTVFNRTFPFFHGGYLKLRKICIFRVKTTEDPLTLGLSIMTVTGTVQKHIATLSRQATRESLTLGK